MVTHLASFQKNRPGNKAKSHHASVCGIIVSIIISLFLSDIDAKYHHASMCGIIVSIIIALFLSDIDGNDAKYHHARHVWHHRFHRCVYAALKLCYNIHFLFNSLLFLLLISSKLLFMATQNFQTIIMATIIIAT